MKLRSTPLALVAIGYGCCALAPCAAAAGEVRISGGSDCPQTVRLVAHDAPLSDVLRRLATALDFKLSFESANDPLINLTATRSPVDLLSLLAPSENLSLTQARDPRCPSHERIAKVWVLPNGSKNLVRAAMAPPPPDPSAEQARRAREGAEMILKSHGIPTPQPEEQDPENPENPENPH
jgi:hypothetical protein